MRKNPCPSFALCREEVVQHIKSGHGLGSTIGYCRSLGRNAHRTNLGIFRTTVIIFSEYGITLSRPMIRYHFYRFVPPQEYLEVPHLEVLCDLYQN